MCVVTLKYDATPQVRHTEYTSASLPATHYNTLQHTATHCNTLQHTATHCNITATTKNTALFCSSSLQLKGGGGRERERCTFGGIWLFSPPRWRRKQKHTNWGGGWIQAIQEDNRVFTTRLVQWLSWVFATQERKKERKKGFCDVHTVTYTTDKDFRRYAWKEQVGRWQVEEWVHTQNDERKKNTKFDGILWLTQRTA